MIDSIGSVCCEASCKNTEYTCACKKCSSLEYEPEQE
jgi:hypothetical protein